MTSIFRVKARPEGLEPSTDRVCHSRTYAFLCVGKGQREPGGDIPIQVQTAVNIAVKSDGDQRRKALLSAGASLTVYVQMSSGSVR